MASTETLGLTGVSYVEISGGTLGSPPLLVAEGQQYPTITSRPSSLQQVFNNAPELLARLLVISDRIVAVLDDRDREAIAETLVTFATPGLFARRAPDIDRIITERPDNAQFGGGQHVTKGNTRQFEGKSDHADRLVVTANDAMDQATKLVADLDAVVTISKPGLHDLTTNGVAQLDELLGDVRRLISSLSRVSMALERDPSRFLFGDHRDGYTPR